MLEKEPNILNELYEFFFKIFIPAFIAVSIKIATQVKREKMSFARILISFAVGIGCAYFVFPFVDGKWTPLIVGVVAMSGEKIAEYIIYKWNIDKVLGTILHGIIESITDTLKSRK